MASDIGTTAGFTTANMRPASGEQIDALWGQNISDNTGFMYYLPWPGPTISHTNGTNDLTDYRGTYYFQKRAGMGTFIGSMNGTVHSSGADVTVKLWVNGSNLYSLTTSASGTAFKGGLYYYMTGLSNGSFYEVSYQVLGASGAGAVHLGFTTWQRP